MPKGLAAISCPATLTVDFRQAASEPRRGMLTAPVTVAALPNLLRVARTGEVGRHSPRAGLPMRI
jgi:hypothetical protein